MGELAGLGIVVGIVSGFFGIGGGTILVPALLYLGFDMKTAVGISVLQMLMASVFGSYLNFRRGTLDVTMVLLLGLGGFAGAQLSSVVIELADARVLEALFLLFVVLALGRIYFKVDVPGGRINAHPVVLFGVGALIGLFCISVGVGGSILLVPILVGFFHVPIKTAISAGLFFVVFSSLSGVISLTLGGQIDYATGIAIGLSSMVGVWLGIRLKHRSSDMLQKRFLMLFYLMVASYLLYRLGSN